MSSSWNRGCKLAEAAKKLSPEASRLLWEAVSDDVSADKLAKALAKNKVLVGATTIRVHRRRECACVTY
jgi:hypothetical protein